jgi:hypothetical protein
VANTKRKNQKESNDLYFAENFNEDTDFPAHIEVPLTDRDRVMCSDSESSFGNEEWNREAANCG